LEVRLVTRIAEDPFIRFEVLYQTRGVDCDCAPLLYGPYVIFAGLDGCWYRVRYDCIARPENPKIEKEKNGRPVMMHREEIRIPHHAGWRIVSVKNANWRYWTLVVQEPITGVTSELLLFANVAIAVSEG
jgi:hypothetical protein